MAAAGAVAGIAIGVYSAIASSRAAKKAARRARRIGRLNAAGLIRQAVDQDFLAREEIRRSYYNAGQLRAAQRASQGAAGINADFGSALQAQSQTAAFAARDAVIIRFNAKRKKADLFHQANIAQLGGDSRAAQLRGQGISDLLSGTSQAVATATSFAIERGF